MNNLKYDAVVSSARHDHPVYAIKDCKKVVKFLFEKSFQTCPEINAGVTTNNPNCAAIRNTIEQAIYAWRDALGIEVEIDNTSFSKVTNWSFAAGLGKCVISYEDIVAGNSSYLAVTSTRFEPTTAASLEDNTNTTKYLKNLTRAKIQIRKELSYGQYYLNSTGFAPTGKVDFYGTILHELGHYFGLGHSIDSSTYNNGAGELMWIDNSSWQGDPKGAAARPHTAYPTVWYHIG